MGSGHYGVGPRPAPSPSRKQNNKQIWMIIRITCCNGKPVCRCVAFTANIMRLFGEGLKRSLTHYLEYTGYIQLIVYLLRAWNWTNVTCIHREGKDKIIVGLRFKTRLWSMASTLSILGVEWQTAMRKRHHKSPSLRPQRVSPQIDPVLRWRYGLLLIPGLWPGIKRAVH